MARQARITRGVIVFTAAAALALGVAVQDPSAGASSEAPSVGLSHSTPDSLYPQLSEAAVADRNVDLAGFYTSVYDSASNFGRGFVDMVVDIPSDTATVYWHGSVASSTPLLSRLAASYGVNYKVIAWPYSHAQLAAAGSAIWASSGKSSSFVIDHVRVFDPRYPGITVQGHLASGGAMTSSALTSVSERVATTSTVKTRVLADSATVEYVTRTTDYQPFNAGGFMTSPKNGYNCSTGFGVRIGTADYVTTARHCSAVDFRTYSGGNLYGTHASVQPTNGGALLLTGKASYKTFSGAYNSSAVLSVVGSPIRVAVGNLVYTSGGNTGVHSKIKVDGTTGFTDDIGLLADAIHAHQSSYSIAAGPGDSGGPVYVLSSSGQAEAVGMIQGGTRSESISCPATSDVTCSSDVYFTPMVDIIGSIHGASLVTATNH